jgi:archaeal flagellar protein FlaJ
MFEEQQKKWKIISVSMGYSSIGEFVQKYFLPLLGVVIVVFVAFKIFFRQLSIIYSLLILLVGIGISILYPIMIMERKKSSIHNNLHLFITYAGTISTMKISRGMLFRRIAQKKVFGEISEISEKILYLSRDWNIGFAKTCRTVADILPSKILGDFLDRFAVMMDFGESLESFLISEQTSVMDDYSTEYNKSLELIRLLQDVFISLTMSLSFGLAIGLLIPLLLGISINTVILIAIAAITLMDVMMLIIVKAIIPDDPLYHDIDIKDDGTVKMQKMIYIAAPLSVILFFPVYFLFKLPFLMAIATAATPLLFLGYFAKSEEEKIFRRDIAFPSFIRTLGSAIEVRSGAVIASLSSLRIHDFGLLNKMVTNLYRRLRIGSEKFTCWKYFAGESGSNLIHHFSRIFAESIYLGGNAEKIGVIISNNFQRLLSLRKLKYQLASGLRGAFYGSLIGLSAVAFVTAQIVKILAGLFSTDFGAESSFTIASILGTESATSLFVNMDQILIYVGIMVIIHAVISSILLKMVDGGSLYASLFDIVLMLWIGAAVAWMTPHMIDYVLPNLTMGGANATNVTAVP